MTNTLIRDCLEDILLNGIKAWELNISQDSIRDGVRLFENDEEVVQTAKSLGIDPDILHRLPGQWRERSPERDELRKVLIQVERVNQIDDLAGVVAGASNKLRAVLVSEVDPERLTIILFGLVFLAMGRFNAEVREIYQEVGCPAESPEQAISNYVTAMAEGRWELATRINTLACRTEMGRIVTRAICRRARRLFTLLVAGNRSGLSDVLVDIFSEIKKRKGER